jgi:Zn-dependent peptidase ImmA (M78 family)
MEDRREAEANRLAREAFIPRGVLRRTEVQICAHSCSNVNQKLSNRSYRKLSPIIGVPSLSFNAAPYETEAFLDDLDSSSMEDRREAEANRLAREAFIPRGVLRTKNYPIGHIVNLAQ